MTTEYFNISEGISKFLSTGTIGVFDGIHLGHQFLLKEVVSTSKLTNSVPTVITFSHHPQSILNSNFNNVCLLSTIEERLVYFESQGIQRVIVCNFNREFSLLNASEFILRLKHGYGVEHFILGSNHTFGYQKSGNLETFPKLAIEHLVTIKCIDPFVIENTKVSSSTIRKTLMLSDVASAEKFLGRPYTIQGVVVKGEQRGKRLGYPTANIQYEPDNKLVPGDGVYCGFAIPADGSKLPALISIGKRSTFGDLPRAIEVHILNFDQNLYGKKMVIEFKQFIRKQIKFDSSEELIAEMNQDRICAIDYFQSIKNKIN